MSTPTISEERAPTQAAILEAVKEADKPLSPQEIVERTGLTKASVQPTLKKMVESGYLVKPDYGLYDVPEAETKKEGKDNDLIEQRSTGWPERFADTFTLTIRREVRPSAGPGTIVYEVDTLESDRLVESKQLFADLLGFWPPDDMEGVYLKGDSMTKQNRARPGLPNGQLVLFQPVEQLWDGKRFVLLLEDEQTGDFRLVAKRVYLHPGGGLRIISDNKGAGIPDADLLPNGSDEHFINKETGLPVRVQVVGRVLWPSEDEEAEQMKLITRTIERMADMGYRLPNE